MSQSGAQHSPVELLTVGDFDPQGDRAIEFDFVGRVIAGRYTIRAHVGGGGMADVFRATDEQLGVDVAIKLLKPRIASDELRARMVQEARAAAQIRHSNLVRVFGTGALDRTAFIVMEWLEGPNLDQYLRDYPNGRMPCQEALELLLPALGALHEIHERGYVHRDIKAGNILVSVAPGHRPTAIVIDLGLVKPDRALRDATSPPTTEVGRLLCTPGYSSPEQAAGLPVDRRSDIYSMAVTLYRVLAGRMPFQAAPGQPLALLAKHIHDEPTLLTKAAGTAQIPAGVAAVIEHAMRKDPAQRPQTMLAFADMLRAATAPTAASALSSPPWSIGALDSLARKFRNMLLAVGAGAVTTVLLRPPPPCSPNEAETAAMAAPAPVSAECASVADAGPTLSQEASPPAVDARAPAEALPEVSVPTATSPPRPTGLSHAASRRALNKRLPEVQVCADRATGGLKSLSVAVNIDAAGRVSAQVVGAPDTILSRCIDAALRGTPVTASAASVSFTHTFRLRPLPNQP
jgi:serine/threonine protein kinase